jgi:hypothetical protein
MPGIGFLVGMGHRVSSPFSGFQSSRVEIYAPRHKLSERTWIQCPKRLKSGLSVKQNSLPFVITG